MNPERVRTTYKRNGPQGAAGDVVYQWSQDVLFLGIFQGMLRMVDVDAGYLRCGGPCQARFPNTEEVMSFAKDPANDLHPTFLQEALAHQDRCFAVWTVTAWQVTGGIRPPTRMTHGFALHFDSTAYPYMHKGFTPAQYRGQRLHGLGMAGALQALTAQGYQGLGFRRGGEQC